MLKKKKIYIHRDTTHVLKHNSKCKQTEKTLEKVLNRERWYYIAADF